MEREVLREYPIRKEAEYRLGKLDRKMKQQTPIFNGILVADIMEKVVFESIFWENRNNSDLGGLSMSDVDTSNSLIKIIEATRLVASNFDVQISVMPFYVNVPDEIALVFEDVFNLVEKLVEQGLLSDYQKKALVKLNNSLDRINVWTVDALQYADEWNAVRMLARHVLTAFNENDTKIPNLFWLQFVSNES